MEGDDISKRIQQTRRECEEVKIQLENLIKAGTRNVIDKEKPKQTESNKIQNIQSCDTKHSEHTKIQKSCDIPKENRIETQRETRPKKVRTHNVAETQEYMKKQREKHAEQLKSKNNEKLKLEIRKNKLEELQRKTRELVERNVALKRARSKSTDKTDVVRLDPGRSRPASRERSRSKSRERIPTNPGKPSEIHSHKITQSKKNDPNLLYPPTPDYLKRKRNRKTADVKENPQKCDKIIILQNTTIKKGDNETSDSIDKDRMKPAQVTVGKSPVMNIFSYKDNNSVVGNRQLPSTSNKNVINQEEILLNLKTDTIPLETITKETQTVEIKKEYPNWLDDQIGISHPLNFINTVKRKLEFSTKTPASTDNVIHKLILRDGANIQHLSHVEAGFPETPRSTKNYREQSNLKSNRLYNCPNLNAEKLENYELIPKQTSERHPTSVTLRTSKQTETGSESDTSKNIPEISSESGTSLRQNAESVRRTLISDIDLNIDTNKIDKMKLVSRRINTATATILSDSVTHNDNEVNDKLSNKKLNCDRNVPHITVNSESKKSSSINYVHDFDTESEIEFDVPCLSKSRESIVSFNSPENTFKSNSNHKTVNSIEPCTGSVIHNIKKQQNDIICSISSNLSSPSHSKQSSKSNVLSEIAEPDQPIHSKSFVPEAVSTLTSPWASKTAEHSKVIPLSITVRNKQERVSNISNFSSEMHTGMSTNMDLNNDVNSAANKKSNDCIESTNNSESGLQKYQKSKSFYPLLEKSATLMKSNILSKSDSNISYINTTRGSGSKSRYETDVIPLRAPTVALLEKQNNISEEKTSNEYLMKNISIRSKNNENLNNTNEIHLKFEAEIHLLNDFKESLRHCTAWEKDFESLKHKNIVGVQLQNNYTQTSLPSTSSVSSRGSKIGSDKNATFSSINFSRGSLHSGPTENLENKCQSILSQIDTSSLMTGLDFSNLNVSCESVSLKTDGSISNFENLSNSNFAGLSVNMFDQLIRDEDARLENLKTILKIREKVLLDRTKGELAWLEIQRKYLKETGKLQEASLVKKKQRGILVNHQKETHEMRRLKQMQKVASTERKSILKKQRNLIRQQLSTKNMLTNIKVNTPRERRMSGPLKVIQSHTESLRSETSISKRNSSEGEREVYSITSHHSHSVVSRVSELSGSELSSRTNVSDAEKQNAIKRTLLMRQTALEKRRKAAEELLQWHKRLLEEEKRIIELESTASAIICQKPDKTANESKKYTFKGKQLNQLWYNITGLLESKFVEDKTYSMSQIALERFCKSAREYSLKSREITRKHSDSDKSEAKIDTVLSDNNIPKEVESHSVIEQLNGDISEHIGTASEYASDFDVESINRSNSENIEVVDQSIHQLIDNFSKIKDNIATFSLSRSKTDEHLENLSNRNKFDKSDSEEEISVIETNKKNNISKEKLEFIKRGIKELQSKDLSNHTSQELSDDVISELAVCSENKELEETDKCKESTSTVPTIEDKVKSATKDIVSKQLHVLDNLSEALIVTEYENISEIELSNVAEDLQVEPKSIIESCSISSEQVELAPEPVLRDNQQPNQIADNQTKSARSANNLSEHVHVDSNILEVPTETEVSSNELSGIPNQDQLYLEKEINSVPSKSTISEKFSGFSEIKSITEKSGKDDQTLSIENGKNEEKSSVNSSHPVSGPVEITTQKLSVSDEQCVQSLEQIEIGSQKLSVSDRQSIQTLTIQEEPVYLASESVEEQIKSSILPKINEETVEDVPEPHKPSFPDLETNNQVKTTREEQETCLKVQKDYIEANGNESLESHLSSEPVEEYVDSEKSPTSSNIISALLSENVQIMSDIMNNKVSKISTENNLPKVPVDITDKITNNFEKVDYLLTSEKGELKESLLSVEEKLSVIGSLQSILPNSDVESLKETDIDEELSTDNIEVSLEDAKQSSSLKGAIKEGAITISPISGSDKSSLKEQMNSYEEKEQDSLSSQISGSLSSIPSEKISDVDREKSVTSNDRSKSSEDKSPRSASVDVKKRISEIMADTSAPRGDKSPRLQDLYVTTYDLVSPVNSPPGSPADGQKPAPSLLFNNEAEEILKKQLAIEQEIKRITEQQQKEQLPFMFVREIPNKPPPPYTPPSPLSSMTVTTIIPTIEEIEEITKYSSKILYKAYLSNNLRNINISENTLNLICKNITKSCYKFVFDLCKEICIEHYKQFEVEKCASWLQSRQRPQLATVKPLNAAGLEKHVCKKLKELFGYEKPVRRENAIIKWSRKKRDHVDEILVMEAQAQEAEWINYDKDELVVMDQVTNEIMNILLKETGQILNNVFKK